MKLYLLIFTIFPGIFFSLDRFPERAATAVSTNIDTLTYPEETHLKNIQQLTFGGDNAEAYFSYDGKYLIFQKTNPKEGIMCDQIYIGKIPEKPGDPFQPKLVSTGKGRTT
ncbi:MAG TPA: hypothetical protein VFX73_02465, partial [Chitinophagaceae bacterium]|nr:hypothetical protein [Chitinophagaceae bacterium]